MSLLNRDFCQVDSKAPTPRAAVWLIEEGFAQPAILASIIERLRISEYSIELSRFPDVEAMKAAARPGSPVCVLLSVGHNLARDARLIRAISRRQAVIATSTDSSAALVVQCTKSGASDFLDTNCSDEEITRCIQTALQHDLDAAEERHRLEAVRRHYSLLTPRERQVLPLLTAGLLNKQAASLLGISLVTLQIHRGNVMRKMRASSFADLVRASIVLESAKYIRSLTVSPASFSAESSRLRQYA